MLITASHSLLIQRKRKTARQGVESGKLYRNSLWVHGKRNICHAPARLNQIMPENNKTSASGATSWGKEIDPYISVLFLLSLSRRERPKAKSIKSWRCFFVFVNLGMMGKREREKSFPKYWLFPYSHLQFLFILKKGTKDLLW